MREIFEYSNYKAFLRDRLPSRGEGRGKRRALAAFIGCQPGFVSQVLNGSLHFSSEQAFAAADFLDLAEDGRDYFLLLLSEDRAGNRDLRSYYARKRSETLKRRSEIQSRIKGGKTTPEAVANEYYGHWKYIAAHMAARNPRLSTPEKIAEYLGIEPASLRPAIDLLLRAGFLEAKGGRLNVTKRRVHLEKYGGNLERHHTHWRLDAVRDLQKSTGRGLHYTSIMSISPDAHREIERILLDAIERSEPVIEAAADQQVSVLSIDLYAFDRRA